MRLDMTTAECVALVKKRGYRLCTPLDVKWNGELCSIAVYKISQYTGKAIHREYVTVCRNDKQQVEILVNMTPKDLEYLVSDGIVWNGGVTRP